MKRTWGWEPIITPQSWSFGVVMQGREWWLMLGRYVLSLTYEPKVGFSMTWVDK